MRKVFVVMRSPSMMEDEGRFEHMGTYYSREEAEARIDRIVTESKGYFSRGSFKVFEANA